MRPVPTGMNQPSTKPIGKLIEIGMNAAIDSFKIVRVEARLWFKDQIISQNYDFPQHFNT